MFSQFGFKINVYFIWSQEPDISVACRRQWSSFVEDFIFSFLIIHHKIFYILYIFTIKLLYFLSQKQKLEGSKINEKLGNNLLL